MHTLTFPKDFPQLIFQQGGLCPQAPLKTAYEQDSRISMVNICGSVG